MPLLNIQLLINEKIEVTDWRDVNLIVNLIVNFILLRAKFNKRETLFEEIFYYWSV